MSPHTHEDPFHSHARRIVTVTGFIALIALIVCRTFSLRESDHDCASARYKDVECLARSGPGDRLAARFAADHRLYRCELREGAHGGNVARATSRPGREAVSLRDPRSAPRSASHIAASVRSSSTWPHGTVAMRCRVVRTVTATTRTVGRRDSR